MKPRSLSLLLLPFCILWLVPRLGSNFATSGCPPAIFTPDGAPIYLRAMHFDVYRARVATAQSRDRSFSYSCLWWPSGSPSGCSPLRCARVAAVKPLRALVPRLLSSWQSSCGQAAWGYEVGTCARRRWCRTRQ
jgi:hypothetical protein